MSKETDTKFYNTTHLSGKDLDERLIVVESQSDKIVEIFKTEPNGLTHHELEMIYEHLHGRIPTSSIYRAVSDLTDSGYLRKTTRKRMGGYGLEVYVWEINK